MAEDSEKNYYRFERGNDNKIFFWQNPCENPNKRKKIFENYDFRGLTLIFTVWKKFCINRSTRPEVFCKNGVLRSFTKFTVKHLCQSLFFSKVAGRRPATLLKKRLWHRCFPVNFVKFLRTSFFTERLWWLLLKGVLRSFAKFTGKDLYQSLFFYKVALGLQLY